MTPPNCPRTVQEVLHNAGERAQTKVSFLGVTEGSDTSIRKIFFAARGAFDRDERFQDAANAAAQAIVRKGSGATIHSPREHINTKEQERVAALLDQEGEWSFDCLGHCDDCFATSTDLVTKHVGKRPGDISTFIRAGVLRLQKEAKVID